MCAAWKKKNERNEIVCFYCTQSDILCGIAKFSRGNKNKLRTFQPQKWKKSKNSQPQTKFTGSYKKRSVFTINWLNFIVWLRFPLEVSDNMCIALVCFPVCDVINFEMNLMVLIKPIFLHDQKIKTKCKYPKTKRAIMMK